MKSILAVAAASVFTLTLSAQETTVYNTIPNPLPGNVLSEGFAANQINEFGDALSLQGPAGSTLHQITIVLSSWACQSGTWATNCVTKPGATFKQSVTMNIYAMSTNSSPAVAGQLLGTITDTFDIPYRPSATPNLCPSGPERWYNSNDKSCNRGIAVPITFNFTNQHVALPQPVIVTVSYNTTLYGPHPIGPSACSSTLAGCPYDSLNVSADISAGVFAGSPYDSNGVFVNYALPNNSCGGKAATGILALDTPPPTQTQPGCWAGYHPEIQVTANESGAKKNDK
jgi:hypothetical protein